jgi:hypothetical protein
MGKRVFFWLGGCLIAMTSAWTAQLPDVLLRVDHAPAHGLVTARIDLASVWKDVPEATGCPQPVRAVILPDETPVPAQFVPEADFHLPAHAAGVVVLALPREGESIVRLTFSPEMPAEKGVREYTARGNGFVLGFAKARLAGLPSRVTFSRTGKQFENFAWNDRLYDPEAGQFWLRCDAGSTLSVVSEGALCTVVRVHARYCQPDGKRPSTQPEAVYDWFVFHDRPAVLVTAVVRQNTAYLWNELHFLELNFPDESFRQWAGGEPLKTGDFTGAKSSIRETAWGALIDGQNAIGLFGGKVIFYDGRGEYGTYMHGPWQTLRDAECRLAMWLWIDSESDPTRAVQTAARQYASRARVALTQPELHDRITGLRAAAGAKAGPARGRMLWRAALAEREETLGRLSEANQIVRGKLPLEWASFVAGALGLALRRSPDGVAPCSLFDLETGRELLAPNPLPLFSILLRRAGSKEETRLAADAGWRRVAIHKRPGGFSILWEDPADERFSGLRVTATASAAVREDAWRWDLRIHNPSAEWTLWDVTFPQIAVADLGPDTAALFPRGPGEIKRSVCDDDFIYRSRYPNGWASMQFMAVYSDPPQTRAAAGLYFARHDPLGSTKEIVLETDPSARTVRLAFEHPVPDMGLAGNDFTLSGEAVWRLFRGDWFDAAMIYKAWARGHARWWPKLTAEGREDTPLWMRELCAWAQTGGTPGECAAGVKAFARFLGVPTGFHWYNWHQIPFDNDYPHYFPATDGFVEAVRDLQQSNVFVMPYINGRLWDTRDKGLEDFEFTRVALPAVTKDEDGKPYTESYGSKETDGSPVRLGVMCPTTPLWQRTVKDIVLRLQNEMGVKGVYIDQIAAAPPALCMDKAHGHPRGGGAWWNEGYWRLLQGIRDAKQPDRMITTECNAEPFLRWLDGYLTWHWQHDGQVPAFPAVYGGAVQMFGRAYGGGPTHDLALRMKAGQQLVFGEQIGWLDPGVVKEAENAAFFRQVVRLRRHLRRYFYAGEMARPPKLIGDAPTVKADWQWSGEWWVTTDAVLTGAWRIPGEKKSVLIFVNVSDAPVTAAIKVDGRAYGLRAAKLRVDVVRENDTGQDTSEALNGSEQTLTFPARTAFAWELSG